MSVSRNQSKFYVRPIFSKKKYNSILLGSSNLYFSDIELIERKNNRTKKKIVSNDDLANLPENIRKIVKEKIRIIKKPLSKLGKINFNKPCIMGILNITPDSFYDGGSFYSKESALSQYNKLVNEGADIIDIGGESTRPGAKKIHFKEEIRRVIPVIKSITKNKIPISLDSRKPEVMSQANKIGIDFINDVSGLRYSKKTFKILKESKLPFIIMHSISNPKNMQKNIKYEDVLLEDNIKLLYYLYFQNNQSICRQFLH